MKRCDTCDHRITPINDDPKCNNSESILCGCKIDNSTSCSHHEQEDEVEKLQDEIENLKNVVIDYLEQILKKSCLLFDPSPEEIRENIYHIRYITNQILKKLKS